MLKQSPKKKSAPAKMSHSATKRAVNVTPKKSSVNQSAPAKKTVVVVHKKSAQGPVYVPPVQVVEATPEWTPDPAVASEPIPNRVSAGPKKAVGVGVGKHWQHIKERHQELFLLAYASSGTISAAADKVGIDRNCHYDWIKADKEGTYTARFEHAILQHNETIEKEIRRRAVDGIVDDVYHNGRVVGQKRIYSDTLLIFSAKANMPNKYKERSQTEHVGEIKITIRKEDEQL